MTFADLLSDETCKLIEGVCHYSQMDWLCEDFYPIETIIDALTLLRYMQLKSDSDCVMQDISDIRFMELAKYDIVKRLRKGGFKGKLPKLKKFQWSSEEIKKQKEPEKFASIKQKERAEELKKKIKKPRQIIIDNVDEAFFDRLKDWLSDKEAKEIDVKDVSSN
jgi:hypothetical protein